MEIPKKYRDLVGTKQVLSGGIFSAKSPIFPTEFNVLDIRVGTATVMSIKEIREKGSSSYEYPTFELLVKNPDMKRSRWTRPFPIREINLKKWKVVSNN